LLGLLLYIVYVDQLNLELVLEVFQFGEVLFVEGSLRGLLKLKVELV
jgi:hypothetical protein